MYTYPRLQKLAYPAGVLFHRGALANVTDAGQDAVDASSVRRGVERQGGFLERGARERRNRNADGGAASGR
jgi:hypothetical protein